MTLPKLDPTFYILTLLKQNAGIYNFIHIDGRQFKNETEKFTLIDTLVQNAIGQTYRLTEIGEKYIYQLGFQNVLQYLADNNNSVRHVTDILKELSIPDNGNELAQAIHLKLRHHNLITLTKSGVILNSAGKHYLSQHKFETTQNNQPTQIFNSGVFIQGSQLNQPSFSDFAKNLPTQAPVAPATKSDQKGNWLWKILSNNWTITIIGGIISGLIIAYFVFVFKWN